MKLKDLLKEAYAEGMSVEDIESALESIDLPTDLSSEVDRLKNALSKSNSEAADYTTKLFKDRTSKSHCSVSKPRSDSKDRRSSSFCSAQSCVCVIC